MAQTITRSADGVPQYDGTPELLPLYREECLQYLMTFEHKKRYLAAPRLVKELHGVAKTAVRGMTNRDPQWVAHPRGVYQLLDHLESVVSRPSLVEASRFVMKFFYQMSRKSGESMTSWVGRHSEALWEASQSLRKVQKEYGPSVARQVYYPQGFQRSSDSSSQTGSRSGERVNADPGPFTDDGRLQQEDDENEPHDYDYWRRESWDWTGWYGHGSSWTSCSWRDDAYEPPTEWDTSSEIFIPEFLAGFLLLHRSRLDVNERANVLAAIKGEFSISAVEKALREQWADQDLARRDKLKQNSALIAEEDLEDEALLADEENPDVTDLDEETREAYYLEQEKIEEAMEAIKVQKATLKEARWKQKQMKLSRNFYPRKPFPHGDGPPSSRRGSQDGGCFRCGSMTHRIAQCPMKTVRKEAQVAFEETAHIAFFSEECNRAHENLCGEESLLGETSNTVLNSCMGVIDSGATSSLGSVEALEKVLDENRRLSCQNVIDIDVSQRPVFRFGNGATKECLSTVRFGLEAGKKSGTMEVHVHDSPGQPILVSRKALQSLGAVIDFSNGTAIYKHVDPNSVVTLERAENGHLLMPLTGNIVHNAQSRKTPFVSLFE